MEKVLHLLKPSATWQLGSWLMAWMTKKCWQWLWQEKCQYWRWNESKAHFLKVSEITLPCPDPFADLPHEKFPHKFLRKTLHHLSPPIFHLNYWGLWCKSMTQAITAAEANPARLKNTTQTKPKRVRWSQWKKGYCAAILWWWTICLHSLECLWMSVALTPLCWVHYSQQWCPH